jgi:regulator of ribonuclease activity A
MKFSTADLCDRYAAQEHFQIAEPILKHYGGVHTFSGPIATLKVFEDYAPVQTALEQPGNGRVLVIDGGGSRRCALIGEQLTALAVSNGWAGIVLYGSLRNTDFIASQALGVMALGAHPLRGRKHAPGESGLLITFAGVNFKQNNYLYADNDGLIVSDVNLD